MFGVRVVRAVLNILLLKARDEAATSNKARSFF
jgi:hypothetical protein